MTSTRPFRDQLLSGEPGGEGTRESEAVEVWGDTAAGRIEDVRYGGGSESALFRIRRLDENGAKTSPRDRTRCGSSPEAPPRP
jgi:hypothetical protein